jgi:hypothetical protein
VWCAAGREGCWCVAAGSVQGQEGEAPFLSPLSQAHRGQGSCSTQHVHSCSQGAAAVAGCSAAVGRGLHRLQHHAGATDRLGGLLL